MANLTGPKIAAHTDLHPQVWVPLATSSIWEGAVVGSYPPGNANAGYLDNIAADPSLICRGVARTNCGLIPSGHVATFAGETIVDEKIWPMKFPATLTTASRGAMVYAGGDNQTGSLLPSSGPPIGALWEVDSTTFGRVWIGPKAIAWASEPAGVAPFPPSPRGVLTALGGTATYAAGVMTGPAATALPTQDFGVVPAINDVWFAPKGLTGLPAAAQAGPWLLTSLGGVSGAWTAERPDWYETGSVIPTEVTLRIGPEGLVYRNTRFTSTAVPGGTVDTTDPVFALGDFGPAAFTARVVCTSLGANTGTTTGTLTITATGALANQDGKTLAVLDRLFVQEGTTNLAASLDAGLYVVAVAGGSGIQAVLTRPPEWLNGAPIPKTAVEIGGEGTGVTPILAGTRWKSFAVSTAVVGTNAPVAWPEETIYPVTLAAGTLGSAITSIPVRSGAVPYLVSNPATAPNSASRSWRCSALTAGVTGSSSVQVVAESAPGTTNASDVGQYNIVTASW